MRRCLLFLLCTGFFCNSYSQSDFRSGYIITNEGDTVNGFIDYRENAKNFKVCDFKRTKSSEVRSYDPDEILGYRFVDAKLFESRKINAESNPEMVFLEVLVKGKAILYKHRKGFYVKKDTFFHSLKTVDRMVETDGKPLYIKDNQYIGVLKYLTSDCPNLQVNPTLSLNEKSLVKLTEKYNECVGEPSITLNDKKEWFNVSFGIEGSFSRSDLTFTAKRTPDLIDYLTSDFDPNYYISGGVSVEFSAPRLSEKLSFITGIHFSKTEYTSINTQTYNTYTDYNEVTFDFKQLKIPWAIRYTFPGENLSPYLNLGLSTTIHLDFNSLWELERETPLGTDFTTSEVQLETDFESLQHGFLIGIGIKKKISERVSGYLESRFERTGGIYDYFVIDSRIENITLLMGINF